jgi:DNA transformation protein
MSEFVEFLSEVFAQFGPVQARKMFGGHGLYHDGIMFGLISDETLYLKGDNSTARIFEARNLEQFNYEKAGKIVKMSYWLAPEEIFEDREEAAIWARRAYSVAVRVQAATKPKRSKREN